MEEYDYEEILNLETIEGNDAEADTIRDYLCSLLELVWSEGEGFSGKRPFGNSGWEFDLYAPLIKGKIIDGTLDEYGRVDVLEKDQKDKANEIIFGCISHIFYGK